MTHALRTLAGASIVTLAAFVLPGPASANAACPDGVVLEPDPGEVVVSVGGVSNIPWSIHICGAQGFHVQLLNNANVVLDDDLTLGPNCNLPLAHGDRAGTFVRPLLGPAVQTAAKVRLFIFPPNTFCAGVGAFLPVDINTFTLVHV